MALVMVSPTLSVPNMKVGLQYIFTDTQILTHAVIAHIGRGMAAQAIIDEGLGATLQRLFIGPDRPPYASDFAPPAAEALTDTDINEDERVTYRVVLIAWH